MREASKAMRRRSKDKSYEKFFIGNGVDIGCGNDKIAKCIPYDKSQGDAELCSNLIDKRFDFLHSSHCLEHLNNPIRGVLNWIRIVKINGYLILTIPDEEMYEKNQWPSIMNYQHLWSFRYGGEARHPHSIDVLTWFEQFKDVEIISIKRITDGYYETDEDLTLGDVECSIEVILKKISHTYRPVSNWDINPFCFMLNSLALGDVIAAVPVVKYMIDNYYTDPTRYKVVAKEMFRSLFSFVPDANFHNFEDKENSWGIPKGWAIGAINQKLELGGGIIRNTPKAMHLSQFASIKVTDRLLDINLLNYVPLPEVDISKFKTDFSNAVIIVSSYRDLTRMWKAEYILEVATWLKKQGVLPVFVGKTDMNLDTHLIPKTSLPNNIRKYGLDLRNKTSIPELATIMSKSLAVVGLDSGPIHLAGCTSTPIICGYTSVDSKFRIPIRKEGITYPIVADIPCNHCESNWAGNFWNYEHCYLGTNECCELLTADKFIEALKGVLK